MLASAVVVARVAEPVPVDRSDLTRRFRGRAAQGIFLDLVAAQDANMAEALHAGAGLRPYTTGVQIQPAFADGEPWRAKLRFTALRADVAELLPVLLSRLPSELRLDDLTLSVESATVDPTVDRDAGTTTYQDILNRWMLVAEEPDTRLSLQLVSPTAFQFHDQNQPLPLPGLLFGSLVDRWNAFSQLALNAEVRRFAEECLAISQFRIESRIVELAGGKQIGAIGSVAYRALRRDSYWLRVIHALADFAFYSGIGRKTTMGMGQARRVR